MITYSILMFPDIPLTITFRLRGALVRVTLPFSLVLREVKETFEPEKLST
jgi:hypothetical protein